VIKERGVADMRQLVANISALVERVTNIAVIASVTLVVPLILVQVVLRYVFARPLFWVEELSRYLILWMVFLSMWRGLKTGAFPGIELGVSQLPAKGRKICAGVQQALVLAFSIVLVREGWNLLSLAKLRNQLSPALRMPMAWVYLCIPVGAGILGFQIIARAITRRHRHGDEKEAADSSWA